MFAMLGSETSAELGGAKYLPDSCVSKEGFVEDSLSIHSIHVKHFHNLVAVCVAVRP